MVQRAGDESLSALVSSFRDKQSSVQTLNNQIGVRLQTSHLLIPSLFNQMTEVYLKQWCFTLPRVSFITVRILVHY